MSDEPDDSDSDVKACDICGEPLGDQVVYDYPDDAPGPALVGEDEESPIVELDACHPHHFDDGELPPGSTVVDR